MAPLVNTPFLCNVTSFCDTALEDAREELEDAKRLSYILACLLGIVCLLFLCSPLICYLPKKRHERDMRRVPPPPENEGIQMQDIQIRDLREPDQFVIDSEEAERSDPNQASHSTLPDPDRFFTVELDGEAFHVANSDATLLAETGVFRGAGDEQQLAQNCVDEGQPTSATSSPSLPRSSYSAEWWNDDGRETSPDQRIGTAV